MFPIEIKSLQIFCYKLAWQILEDILMIQNYKYQQRSFLLKIKTSKWTNNTDKIKLWERQTETHTLTLVFCQLWVLPALADVIHDARKPKRLYGIPSVTRTRLGSEGHNQEPPQKWLRHLTSPSSTQGARYLSRAGVREADSGLTGIKTVAVNGQGLWRTDRQTDTNTHTR